MNEEFTAKVQSALRQNLDRTAIVLDIIDHGLDGLVLWRRELPGPYGPRAEYNVHRWATRYTDGQPVTAPGGVMFYSGDYCRTLSEAQAAMKERA